MFGILGNKPHWAFTTVMVLWLMALAHSAEAHAGEDAHEPQEDHKILRLYLDADRWVGVESARSIEWGINTALSEINHNIQGYTLELTSLDHRGNVLRSLRNFKQAIEDNAALAVFSGIHSPPLIRNREFINKSKMLTLVPWAAAAPITRYPSEDNWIFRLSIDDSRAGEFLADYAVSTVGCEAPMMMLESTPWGDNNLTNIGLGLADLDIENVTSLRFSINIGENGADTLIARAYQQKTDCILFVGNAREGASVLKALAKVKDTFQPKVISHWGITSGKFELAVPFEIRQQVDLSFIQSCFSFLNSQQTDLSRAVFERARRLYPEHITTPADIKSPVGFIHAYDLTRLLLNALTKVELGSDILENRNAVRLALENLDQRVEGLVKNYNQPFSVFNAKTNPNAHEALGPDNYCMARYTESDDIALIEPAAGESF